MSLPEVSLLCGVNNQVFVYPEQVGRSDALALVGLLALVGHLLPNQLANVLDNHVSRGDVPNDQRKHRQPEQTAG